jgi:dUTP pyrophosphatase
MSFLVKVLSANAKVPSRSSDKAAGYDLSSAEESVVPARGRKMIKTGIAISVPVGHYGRVAPRSGLTLKNGIDVGAGVIDEDYRGEVCVILFNHSDEEFVVNIGDRIAQLILEKISTLDVEVVNSLDITDRGDGGFGSTGIN